MTIAFIRQILQHVVDLPALLSGQYRTYALVIRLCRFVVFFLVGGGTDRNFKAGT